MNFAQNFLCPLTLSFCIFAGLASAQTQNNPAQNSADGKAGGPEVAVVTTPGSNLVSAIRPEPLRADQITTGAQVIEEANVQIKAGNASGASARLSLVNVTKPDSTEWHLETTGRLMELAARLSRTGKTADTKTVVTESLKQLDSAERVAKSAGDTVGQARAKSAAARIHERYRGDSVAALASYQSALELNPQDQGTKEAYERLKRSYENAQARAQPAKSNKR